MEEEIRRAVPIELPDIVRGKTYKKEGKPQITHKEKKEPKKSKDK